MSKRDRIRLHKAVKEYVAANPEYDYTLAEIQRNIGKYGVNIDGETFFDRLHWLGKWQQPDIQSWPQRESLAFEQIRVLEENSEYMVIWKPKNMVVHAGAGHRKQNLITWLRQNYDHQKNFDPDTYPQAGLVHRLDKQTQGLLLIAKNPKAHLWLQNQFRQRQVTKIYYSIVKGVVDASYHLKHWQARDIQNIRKQKLFWEQEQAMEYDPKAREARTSIQPLAVCVQDNLSLLQVQIFTGRMHQIRVVCEALGFPLDQDQLYNQKYSRPKTDTNPNLKFNPSTQHKFLTSQEMSDLRIQIFGDTEYALMAAKLGFRAPDGSLMDMVYREADKLICNSLIVDADLQTDT